MLDEFMDSSTLDLKIFLLKIYKEKSVGGTEEIYILSKQSECNREEEGQLLLRLLSILFSVSIATFENKSKYLNFNAPVAKSIQRNVENCVVCR